MVVDNVWGTARSPVKVSGPQWRIALPVLDDDPRGTVLINGSLTGDAFIPASFPARPWTVVLSPSLLPLQADTVRFLPVEIP